MVVFEADIFVGQSEDEVEVRCEVSRRVKIAVSRYNAQHLGEIEPTRGRKGLSQKRRGDREGGGALPVVSVRLRLPLKGSPPR